ncbi:flagellar hook-length control protein FliK [bacterium]|nr:flagellar hook-length control protein FliK [bacterium]MBU1989932.1 flagellar hook-length control protein FliK [bacterium]
MISADVQNKTNASSPLSLSTPDEKPTLSFSELLKGAGSASAKEGKLVEKNDKVVQNGSLVLSLSSDEKDTKNTKASSKNSTLLSLLRNEEESSLKIKDNVEINPKLSQHLSTAEIKTLVADAKEYLKSKILQSDEYKKSQIKELPSTLKGLAELAKKVGIDISKITVEEVQPKAPALKTEDLQSKNKSTNPQSQKELSGHVQKDKPELPHAKQTERPVKSSIPDADKTQAAKPITQAAQDKENKLKENSSQAPKVDDKNLMTQKEIKATPLFKAQSQTEHTTEQFVLSKQFKVEEKTPKDRADETLKLLLRGEKPSQANPALTADFSVATAKVLAPSAATEVKNSLEKLLHGEGEAKSETTVSKTDAAGVLKAESFEVKLNEAKQMIKYLSSDVKTAIEDYKSPFTRVKVQLNPQKLGEVDLTIVQRGNNLHVNISSNNSAINTLVLNANELRTQLNNNGINNATLNFNNQSESGNSQNGGQQQQRHNDRQAHEEYNYFTGEQDNEEILSSLEIIVPRYI